MTEPLPIDRFMALAVAFNCAPVEANQADSVGRFWSVRVPSAQVSSSRIVAPLFKTEKRMLAKTTVIRNKRFIRLLRGFKNELPRGGFRM